MSYSLAEELLEHEIKEFKEYLSKKNEKEWDFNKDGLEGANNTRLVLMGLFSRFLSTTSVYCPKEFEKIIKLIKD